VKKKKKYIYIKCQLCLTSLPPQLVYKHYLRALSRWPTDPLRPDCQFQDAMRRRIDQRLSPQNAANVDARAELEQVNALYSLLENRYSKKVCRIADGMRWDGEREGRSGIRG
jgi:hypothetical protein